MSNKEQEHRTSNENVDHSQTLQNLKNAEDILLKMKQKADNISTFRDKPNSQ